MRIGQVRPALPLLLLAVGATLVTDGSSSASSACVFNASTGVATVTLSGAGTTTVRRSGNTVQVDGATCGTVGTVDTLAIDGDAAAQTLVVNLSGGPLGPGNTAEPTGTSEIELIADLGTAREDTISVQGASGVNTVRAGDGGINLNGDADADVTGPGAGGLASAGAGGLVLNGGAEGDVLSGAGGAGTGGPVPNLIPMAILGGSGADTLTGGDADDEITGGPGGDAEAGAGGNDTFLQGGAPDGADTLVGGDQPADHVDYSARQAAVGVTLAGAADDGESGEGDDVHVDVEQVTGGAGDDTIVADQVLFRAVTFFGEGGDDALTLGDQSDVAYGGTGEDTILGRDGTDWLIGGPGDDLALGEAGMDTFFEDASAPGTIQVGANGADDLRGGPDHDIVTYRNRETGLITVTMGDNAPNDGAGPVRPPASTTTSAPTSRS